MTIAGRFIISNHQAFQVYEGEDPWDDMSFTIRKVPYLFDEDVISHPDPRLKKKEKMAFPREISDKIVSFLIASYIRTREFGQAAQALSISKAVLYSWWRWYANRLLTTFYGAGDMVRQLSRTLCLLQSIYDDAYTGEVLQQHSCHYPSLGITHPFGYSVANAVKPHHLVRQNEDGYMMAHLELRQDHNRCLDGMNRPVVMYTGPRLCDVMVGNIDSIDEGIYSCNEVVFPILLIKINAVTTQKGEEWERARHQWKRFADLVRMSMDGCELYMETTRMCADKGGLGEGTWMSSQARKVFVKP